MIGLALVTGLASCNEPAKEDTEKTQLLEQIQLLEQEAAKLEEELTHSKANHQAAIDSLSALIGNREMTTEEMNIAEENEGWAKYTGDHLLTLQWIEGKPGKATFELLSEGEFEVEGEQRNDKGDYVTLSGTVLLMGKRELNFNGKIASKVSYINNGEECFREGDFTFKASGKRKYWRLQQMDNCEGDGVVDYVDIFFK